MIKCELSQLQEELLILNVILNCIASHADLEFPDTLHPKMKTYSRSSKYIELWSPGLMVKLLYVYLYYYGVTDIYYSIIIITVKLYRGIV